jgi:hypothetical protein
MDAPMLSIVCFYYVKYYFNFVSPVTLFIQASMRQTFRFRIWPLPIGRRREYLSEIELEVGYPTMCPA